MHLHLMPEPLLIHWKRKYVITSAGDKRTVSHDVIIVHFLVPCVWIGVDHSFLNVESSPQ